MSPRDLQPYSRREHAVALTANAVASPFNLALLVVLTAAGVVAGAPLALVLPVALAVYAAACARTFLDPDVSERVATGARQARRAQREDARPPLDVRKLDAAIAAPVLAARERRARIHDAVERAELPYTQVADEVDGFLALMEDSARRAQLLKEVVDDGPTARIDERLAALPDDSPSQPLREALTAQRVVAARCEQQLLRYDRETERLLVELDTIRASLVSGTSSSDGDAQRRLGADVQRLREAVGVLAEGMDAAFGADATT